MKLQYKLIASIGFTILLVNKISFKVSAQDMPATADKLTDETINVHLFYSKTCSHCKDEISFLKDYVKDNSDISVSLYEVTSVKENARLLSDIIRNIGANVNGVPVTFIGDKYFVGFGPNHDEMIDQLVTNQRNDPVQDIVKQQMSGSDYKTVIAQIKDLDIFGTKKKINTGENNIISIPIFGDVNLENLSLPIITFVIAIVDGFNPCAMWTLLFLISLLLGIQDRRRMWYLGTLFILTSGAVYFLFMVAWLNFFIFIGYIPVVQYIIGLASVVIGILYLRDYIVNKASGCKITSNEKRARIFSKLRNAAENKSILLASIGIILTAFAVNLVEVACSAGLPAIYTNILSINSLTTIQYFAYIFGYILVFMLDDMVVYIVAMTTLKAVGIESKYSKYSHLIGGIIVFLIGVAMIFKPEILHG